MRLVVFLSAALILVSGCNDKVPLKGRVTFSDDGSPLTSGTVLFSSENFQSSGTIKPDGTFTVTSVRPGDGLPPGTYRVAVVANNENLHSLVDPKLQSPDQSGLTLTVDKSTKSYDIKVDRNKAPAPPPPL